MSRWNNDITSRSCRFLRLLLLIALSAVFSLPGCAAGSGSGPGKPDPAGEKIDRIAADSMKQQFKELPTQTAAGINILGNETVTFDISNAKDGYYCVTYLGTNQKVKLQVTGPDQIKYTYNLTNESVFLPISGGNGTYELTLFENISGDQYSTAFKGSFDAALDNEFLPYLYSNMYVNYAASSRAVTLAGTLAEGTSCDLETISSIYHYIINTISYDHEEAKTVAYNYLPVLDEVLETRKGICFDYAALMAGMLRSQRIPTRLQIGYAGSAYHAWISTYIEDVGWIDGIIRFDGQIWSLMDPTFAANKNNADTLKQFIGDGNNYKTLYTY